MATQIADRDLVERVRTLASSVLSANAAETDKSASFPSANIQALADAGLLGLLVPRAAGGLEADGSEFVDCLVEIAGACASTGMVFVMHCCGTEVIKRLLTAPRREEILKQIASGKHLSTLACSERATGIHFYASYSQSQKSDGGYEVSGEKCFVTSARHADSYVISSQAAENGGPVATSLYLVEKGARGQTFEGTWSGVGLKGNSSCVMRLDNCFVSSDSLLGGQGEGVGLSVSVILPRFLLGTAAVYTGIAKAALDATCSHVNSRKHTHTGEALAELPTMRRAVGEMKVSVDSSLAYLRKCAADFEKRQSDPAFLVELMEAKLIACKTAKDVTLAAMQNCGGIAYSSALPIERYMRDALAGSVMAPSHDALLDFIGKAALGQPLM